MQYMYVQFGFIALCFLIAAYYKKPWAALFTMLADFFLVIKQSNEIGVTIFIAAHACYIIRFGGSRKLLPFCFFCIFPAGLLMWVGSNFIDLPPRISPYLIFVSVVYKQFFIMSLYTAISGYLKNRFQKPNGRLIVAGMLLFAACDVCVLIYNVSSGNLSQTAFKFIWVFYAPSQLLLALSARNYGNRYPIKK